MVGRIVATAAAQHLTPTTLELGGKNPAIVDKDVDIEGAARKLLWAKNGNSGQTCTAPDYIMVHRDVHAQFVAAMIKACVQLPSHRLLDKPSTDLRSQIWPVLSERGHAT